LEGLEERGRAISREKEEKTLSPKPSERKSMRK
jgi:hypothetical protein